MTTHATHSRRTAFTLVELLVVVAIIGVLAAILIPTLAAAMQTAREGAVVNELKQLEMAMEDYRQKNGGAYPPDFTPGPNAADLPQRITNHVRSISNKSNNRDLRNSAMPATQGFLDQIDAQDSNAGNGIFQPRITQDEALVFWLRYTRADVEYPLTGGGPSNTGYDDVSAYNSFVEAYEFRPMMGKSIRDSARSYFEFDEARLIDFDNDGYPSYVPRYGPEVPYVYFDSRTYLLAQFNARNLDLTNGPSPTDPPANPNDIVPEGNGVAQPLGQQVITVMMQSSIKWHGEDKFQIIAPGFDGNYGTLIPYTTGMTINYQNIKLFPDGRNFRKEERDNFGNFAGGRFDKQLDN